MKYLAAKSSWQKPKRNKYADIDKQTLKYPNHSEEAQAKDEFQHTIKKVALNLTAVFDNLISPRNTSDKRKETPITKNSKNYLIIYINIRQT